MRILYCLSGILMLGACEMTSPDYAGIKATRVTVLGSVFDVRRRGDRAQAVRMNPEGLSRYDAAMTRAVIAIEQVTECDVIRVAGDPSAAEARLDCGPGSRLARQPVEYDCDAYEVYDGLYQVECEPGI
ncbi:hypothetical protein [Roseovarius sp. 2305UL8-3]|uniref:hypothetical protein n=1 Tax=Roseovarius conchicola TaxID=3121636 RepID=UPI003527F531